METEKFWVLTLMSRPEVLWLYPLLVLIFTLTPMSHLVTLSLPNSCISDALTSECNKLK